MRIELAKNFCHSEVAKWMNEHIGPMEENITWFWSHGDYYEEPSPYYKNGVLQKLKPEGVNIWKDCPEQFLAALKWG
jgi:hypothetical protein